MSRYRWVALFLAVVVGATAAVFFPQSTPAHAEDPKLCSIEEWKRTPDACVDRLQDVSSERAKCLQAPAPGAPDAGMAGWFVSRPESSKPPGPKGLYSLYGYAGYSYTTYDIGCEGPIVHPDYKFETSIANGEFMIASGILGASNALRERAWDPGLLWGWADDLVDKATKAVYSKVFTIFGAITLVIVGLYLIWRSRQANLSDMVTTAGWAILVLVVVTALAAWPVWSARAADAALTQSLSVVHDAVGPGKRDLPPGECERPDDCKDKRTPAVRASDIATETLLYRNWLRGTLGSADSVTAQKYGRSLYNARSFTWKQIEDLRNDPKARDGAIADKKKRWTKIAEQIKKEDPEAYEYLQGAKGWERVGAGFVAILSTLFFALFDLTAALLVLLGFMIFRWAVIAAPIIGTIGLLRPASTGFRRLVNAVVAAIFNILAFGIGAAIYLFAVDIIMRTASLPGWLQIVLILLTGVVGWLLLRPHTRVTRMGGGHSDATTRLFSANTWRLRKESTVEKEETKRGKGKAAEDARGRPETRDEERTAAPSGDPLAIPGQLRSGEGTPPGLDPSARPEVRGGGEVPGQMPERSATGSEAGGSGRSTPDYGREEAEPQVVTASAGAPGRRMPEPAPNPSYRDAYYSEESGQVDSEVHHVIFRPDGASSSEDSVAAARLDAAARNMEHAARELQHATTRASQSDDRYYR